MKKAWKYQQKILDDIKNREKVMLALDMGLGKTFITIKDWYDNHSNNKHLFIITKPSIVNEWEQELKDFDDIKIFKLNKGSKKSIETFDSNKDFKEKKAFIISYQTLWRNELFLKIRKNTLLLAIDESHSIKNRKSNQSKFIYAFSRKFDWMRMLTGTPMSIGYIDWFWQLKTLVGEYPFKYFKDFENNYIVYQDIFLRGRNYFKEITGYKNIDDLKDEINKYVIFLSTKETGIDLPEQIFKTIEIDYDPKVKKALRDKCYKTWMIKNSGSKFMAHRTSSSGFFYGENQFGEVVVEKCGKQFKMDVFRDLIERLKSKSIYDKILIFYNFNQEKQDIVDIANEMKLKVSYITSQKKDLSGELVLTHYQSGSTGINLQNDFSKIVFYSPTTSGTDHQQAIKRIHRQKQKNTCYYYFLITKKSVEEKILEKVKENKDYTEEMFLKDE